MSARPNLTKTLVELLKAAGVKVSKRGQHALVVDDQPVAQVYDAALGAIRLFVTDKRGKLPAKLAKPFKLNQTRGYAKLFKSDDDLTPAVEAIKFVAEIEVAEKPKRSTTRKTSTAKPNGEAQPEPQTDPQEPNVWESREHYIERTGQKITAAAWKRLLDETAERKNAEREAAPTADIDALLAAADKSDKSVSEELIESDAKPSKTASKTTSTRKRKTASTRKTTSRKRSRS